MNEYQPEAGSHPFASPLMTLAGRWLGALPVLLMLSGLTTALAATTVPMEAQMPGTQPEDNVVSLNLNDDCQQCHEDSGDPVTVVSDWRGSMMSHAGRDPLLWATMAIAEQDFDGSGDLCLRCHTMTGWLGGESTPTDGAALASANAAEGVGCEVCHKMTNPDNTEIQGLQVAPYIANDGGNPVEGYYGSAQLSMLNAQTRLGPYSDASASHSWQQSLFHRSVDFCGSCHDVSNPVVGDLAPNNGAQTPLAAGTFDGQLDTPTNPRTITDKAAFNNPPYKYGVVERTYSEYKAGLLSQTLVSDYDSLPADLQAGAIQLARNAAQAAGTGGNYADNTPRYFSCQTCHMRATTQKGCSKNSVQLRTDQPMHDLTGGNYWMPDVIQYMDAQDTLLIGDNLTALENSGIVAGKSRALDNLNNAAALSVSGNVVKVVNLTGHKLISGYPEGRRMWLKIEWYDGVNPQPLRVDGDYGPLQLAFDVNGDGNVDAGDTVDSLLDLHDPNTRIYEVHGAISQDWAAKLLAVSAGYAGIPVAYDRITGAVTHTVGDIAAQAPGTAHETFHFVLNNTIVKDTRIPPYGMDYDESLKRNILPVPATQYGNPGPGGTFDYWDAFTLNPPAGAVSATIRLMYQPTSWEYIQFLDHANNGSVAFLASEGANLLDAWLNTGMAAPHEMATASWTTTDSDGDGLDDSIEDTNGNGLVDAGETDPNNVDTDGDGLVDGAGGIVCVASGPGCTAVYPAGVDADNDGYVDGEQDYGNDPTTADYADGNIAPLGMPDTVVDVADLLITTRFAISDLAVTPEALGHIDMNADGQITVADVLQLLKIVLP